jgi:mucin-2
MPGQFPAGATDPGDVASFNATIAGEYSVIVTDANTCSGNGSGTLTVNENPTVTVNSPTVCASELPVAITATPSPAGSYSYAWTVPAGATDPGDVASFNATIAGEYSVIVTDANTCSGNGSGTLTVNENPTVSVNSPTVCASELPIAITATPSPAGSYSYAWTVPAGATDPGDVASFNATSPVNTALLSPTQTPAPAMDPAR